MEFDNFVELLKDRYKNYELDNISLEKPNEITNNYENIKNSCLNKVKINNIAQEINSIKNSRSKVAKYILLAIHTLSLEELKLIE